MKPRPASDRNRPFAVLAQLLARNRIRLPEVNLPTPPPRPLSAAEEKALFDTAMAGVVPLADNAAAVAATAKPRAASCIRENPDAEALRRLERLVATGEGFVASQTAEYMEGACGRVAPEIFRRLHGGHFAIQGHVDLHGMRLAVAREAFDRFMRRSISQGRRCVLVVHGRGRCSPGPPVLKPSLAGWLTRGPWKRWIIAFTSARGCDGGTGATYVLLRRAPRPGRRR